MPKPAARTTPTVPPSRRRPLAPRGDAPAEDAGEGRRYAGASLAERAAARRQRFIEAGVAVFGTLGFRAATVRGLCAEAGLTDRYFYESFDNLEALLGAVYAGLMDTLRDRLQRLHDEAGGWKPDPADVERRLTACYRIWFDLLADPRVARIVLHEVLGVSPAIDALYQARIGDFATFTAAPLQQAAAFAGLAAARRALVGRALVGASIQVAEAWVSGGYREPRDEVVRTCVLVTLGTLHALEADLRPAAPRRAH